MVQKVSVVLVDDIDGSEADQTVTFALDGVTYEIDLSAANAAKLREDFAGWVGSARRSGGARRTAASASRSTAGRSRNGEAARIRAWASENGHTVSERGRIPATVKAAYDAAH